MDLGQLKDDTFNQVKRQFGDMRKAGAILSGSPLGLLAAELIFPPATAAGTLDAELKRNQDAYPKSRVY